jgi:predicted small secreted protein
MEATMSKSRVSARALLLALALAALAPVLSACNTTAGAGEDLSATGKAVTRGADKVKSGL